MKLPPGRFAFYIAAAIVAAIPLPIELRFDDLFWPMPEQNGLAFCRFLAVNVSAALMAGAVVGALGVKEPREVIKGLIPVAAAVAIAALYMLLARGYSSGGADALEVSFLAQAPLAVVGAAAGYLGSSRKRA